MNTSLARFLWFFALALLLVPLFWVKTVVTQDGAAHLYNAFVLQDWAKNVDFYNEFYKINTIPSPNWLSEGLLAGLICVFSPDIAEKIIQGVCILMLPLGLRYAITGLRPKQGLWALLVVPLAYNFVFFYGFYNFCLSLPLSLFTIGYIWRKPENTTWQYFLGLSALLLLNYFTHPVAWLVVCSVWFGWVLQLFFIQKKWSVFIKNCALLLPTFALFAVFAERNGLSFFEYKLHKPLIQWVVLWQAGVAFEDKEKLGFAFLGIAATALLFWFLLKKIIYFYKKNDVNGIKITINTVFLQSFIQKYTFFAIPLAFLSYLYVLVPDFTAGGGYLTIRIAYFLLFFVIIALSLLDNTAFAKEIMAFIAILTTCTVYTIRLPNMQKASDFNENLMQIGEKIPEKAVVLTLNYMIQGERLPMFYPEMYMFKHIAARIGTRKPMILLENYEANTTYFPLLWKKECNPYKNMGEQNGIDNDPPTADIAEYERISGKKVSHVVVIGQLGHAGTASQRATSDTVFTQYESVWQNNNVSLFGCLTNYVE